MRQLATVCYVQSEAAAAGGEFHTADGGQSVGFKSGIGGRQMKRTVQQPGWIQEKLPDVCLRSMQHAQLHLARTHVLTGSIDTDLRCLQIADLAQENDELKLALQEMQENKQLMAR